MIAIKTRPAAWKLHSFPFSTEEKEKLEKWKWVYVTDLIECLNNILENKSIGWRFKNDQVNTLTRFVLLNKREGPVGLFTWVSGDTYKIHSSQFPDPQPLYVPEPWSNLIIEMVEQGVVAVSAATYTNDRSVDLKAHMYDESIMWLHWQGGEKYKLHPPLDKWRK